MFKKLAIAFIHAYNMFDKNRQVRIQNMRGVETRIQEIRHRIFREVARMAYHTEWPVDKRIEELPYKIIPGEVGNFRNDVF